MTEGYDIDLAVVGSGGAAMSAAITARQAGHSVAFIERGTPPDADVGSTTLRDPGR